jgi:hypothetical protein
VARKPRPKSSPRRPGTRRGDGSKRAPTVYTGTSKRVIAYLEKHPHATVAQARGHKPDEHRTRKERARAAGKLDENQRNAIRRYAKQQAVPARMNTDSGELYRAMLERFERPGGWREFEGIKARVASAAKGRRRRHRVRRLDKAGNVVTLEMAPYQRVWEDFEDYAERHDIPEGWIYYR